MLLAFLLGFVLHVPASAAPLDAVSLKALLLRMGHDVCDPDEGLCEIILERDDVPVTIRMTLSRNGRQLRLDCKLTEITRPEQSASTAFLRLLEQNDKVAPNFFVYDKPSKTLHMMRTLENIDIEAKILRRAIDQLDQAVRTTAPEWSGDVFRPMKETDPPITPMPMITRKTVPHNKLNEIMATWRVVGYEANGTRQTAEELADSILTFEFTDLGLMIVRRNGVAEDTIDWDIEELGLYPAINLISKEGKVEKAIIQLERNRLRISYADAGIPRPTRFSTTEGSNGGVFTLERLEMLAPPPPPKLLPPSTTDIKKLVGTWRVVLLEMDGNRLSEEDLADTGFSLVFSNNKLVIRRKNIEDEEVLWTIDSTSDPIRIDMLSKGSKLEQGILRIDRNKMTLCYSDPGEKRPTAFAAPEGFPGGLMTLVKIK